MINELTDYYSLLGAQPSASIAEIRKKYRQAALCLHPDKGGSSEAFQRLGLAFEILSCPVSRALYDKTAKDPLHWKLKAKGATTSRTDRESKNTTPCCLNPNRRGLKRHATVITGEPQSKRCRANLMHKTSHLDKACGQDSMHQIGSIPFQQLRDVLQHMNGDDRRAALKTLEPCVRAALLHFMETTRNMPAGNQPATKHSADTSVCASITASAVKGGRKTITTNADSAHVAHIHVKALRFYTRGCHDLDLALDHQMVLVQMRQALSAASMEHANFWDDPAKAYQTCLAVLHENDTSEHDLGLSAYVYLRAGHLLKQGCTIISPVMPLDQVLQLHARLLHARRTSWQNFRAEWIQLMQSKWVPPTKRKTQQEAEAYADAARSIAIWAQFQKAAVKAAKAIRLEEIRKARQRAWERRTKAADKTAVALSKKQEVKARMKAWKVQRLWSQCPDVTLDDAMRGPPVSFMSSCKWKGVG